MRVNPAPLDWEAVAAGDWPSSLPAVAYGPRARNIHGTDEAVELASIVSGALVLARFIAGFFAGGGR